MVACDSQFEPSVEGVGECAVLRREIAKTMKVFFDFRYASYMAASGRVEEPFDVVPIALIAFGSYRKIDPPEFGRSSGKNAWGRANN